MCKYFQFNFIILVYYFIYLTESMIQSFLFNNIITNNNHNHNDNRLSKIYNQSIINNDNRLYSLYNNNNNNVQHILQSINLFSNNSHQNQYYVNKILNKDVEEQLNNFSNNEIDHFNDSLETSFSINEPSNELYSPVNTILPNLSKQQQQVDINLDSNTNLRFVKYFVGETIRMRCIIPEGSHVIIWNKIGEEYPLTIGNHRFIPDKRISIKQKSSNKWILRIIKAKLTDSGLYTCTTKSIHNEYNINDHSNQTNRNRTLPIIQKNNPDYYISVVEPQLKGEKQANITVVSDNFILKNRTLTVTGPRIVYYGSPLELKCYAKFSTDVQSSGYEILLEWYHHGIRKSSDPFQSGSVYIEQKWLDPKTLESRLFIKWASESDTGQWICLERYKPSENNTEHDFPQVIHLSPIHKSLLSTERIQNNRLPISSISKNRPLSLTSPLIPTSRIMFGRIEVEIIDISKNPSYIYSNTDSNSKFPIQSTVKNFAYLYKTKWFFVNFYLSIIILKYFL
ncbi:unnamed protein product [Schistosoma rodhaini]|uniref:Ig-like domain-containing protein n=1 Tax=Schistosoma rodhaini TaxID=6188 RepID=A0AA85GGF5_9TREM|nr:unnamed protein product [Schistosoma rodhaini]